MPSAQVLHLLTAPPQATPPDPQTLISAVGSLGVGTMTTQLLDPAVPSPVLSGTNQVVQYGPNGNAVGASPTMYVFGRWLTRLLPAQTVAAGTWKLSAAVRLSLTGTLGGINFYVWGFTVAQWRPGTGVIARAVDTPAAASIVGTVLNTGGDYASSGTITGGSALTLLANDCLILEVWSQITYSSGSGNLTAAMLLGGLGQYHYGGGLGYTNGVLTNTDAVLVAPAAITFS